MFYIHFSEHTIDKKLLYLHQLVNKYVSYLKYLKRLSLVCNFQNYMEDKSKINVQQYFLHSQKRELQHFLQQILHQEDWISQKQIGLYNLIVQKIHKHMYIELVEQLDMLLVVFQYYCYYLQKLNLLKRFNLKVLK